jgi:hypothetical protein
VLEILEARSLLTVTSINILSLNPTEGAPLGSANAPSKIATFTVNNYTGVDESSQYSAEILWGDGTVSSGLGPVTISFLADLGNGNAQYGVFSYHTYAEATTTANPYSLTVIVDDNTGPGTIQAQSGPVSVNDAPLTNSFTPGTINATVGTGLTNVTVGQFIDTNPLAKATDYSVQVNWGDGQFSSGVVVPYRSAVQLGGTGVEFTVVGSHTYTTTGSFTVTTTINDLEGSSVTETSSVTIANSTLQHVTAAPISAVEGQPFTGTVASFTDPNPNDKPSDFTATINWGNGDSTAGTVTASGSAFLVTAVDPVTGKGYTYPEEGSYNVTITVKGPAGAQFTAFSTATVADAPLTATGLTLGVAPNPPVYTFPAFSGEVATFTDADPNGTLTDYTATINWGDGASTPGTITLSPTTPGTFVVSGTHQYGPSSVPYQASITIKDVGGATATATTSITVTNTPLTPGTGPPTAITAIEGQPFTAQLGTFTDPNPAALPSQFAETINWGDNTTSSGVIGKQANGTFTVSGSHTYAEESPVGSPYAITVTIANIIGTSSGSITDMATATVADAPLTSLGSPINGVEGIGLSPSSSPVATFTDADPNGAPGDYTAMINWGDGTALTPGTIVQTGTSPNGSTFTVSGSHTYVEEATYQTQVTITDAGGSKTVAVGNAVIAEAPLAVSATQPAVNSTEGMSFSTPVASFTDSNPVGTISDFTAVINWGDGTPNSAGTVTQLGGPGTTFVVSGTHVYADSGVNGGIGHFPLTVYVRDVGGATVTIANTANVADVPLTVTGRLDPASDSGASNSDDITNVVQPTFTGTTNEPNATMTLYAQPLAGGGPFVIGQGTSNSNDAWSIVSNQALADGSYAITAIAVDQAGHTTSSNTTIVPDLVIDTVGPKVTGVFFNHLSGQIQVTFQDFGGPNNAGVGLNPATVRDANNYRLTTVHQPRLGAFRVNVISVSPGTTTGSQSVTLSLNRGQPIRGGFYDFTIRSVSPKDLSGIQDIAGNALDGEFYGYFPSGNNRPGGDFVAELDTVHHIIFAPNTVVGRATPVSPPGTRPRATFDPRTLTGGQLHMDPIDPRTLAASRLRNGPTDPRTLAANRLRTAPTVASSPRAGHRVPVQTTRLDHPPASIRGNGPGSARNSAILAGVGKVPNRHVPRAFELFDTALNLLASHRLR